MSKTLKIGTRGDAPVKSERTRQPLRGRNRNNQSAVPTRPAQTESRPSSYGDRPQRSFDDKPRGNFGDRPRGNFNDRNDRPPRREGDAPRRDFGDRPQRSFDDKPRGNFGDRPRGNFNDRNDRPPRRDGDAPRRDFSDRPQRSFDDKPRGNFGDRPRGNFNDRNDRPPRRDGDAPRRDFSDRPQRSFDDKPRGNFGDRPRGNFNDRNDRPPRRDGDAPRRDFGDRPQRSFDDKPRGNVSDKPRAPRREVEVVLREASDYAASRGREPRATDRDPNAGIRVSKYLTETGVCSRREADHYIDKGWVTVNGKRAVLGQRVLPTDNIQLARQLTAAQEKRMTILINKPVGFVSGQAEDGYVPAVNLIEPASRWEGDTTTHELENVHVRGMAPAGRLDIDSTGLLVLTQDGRIAKALIGDKSEIDKEYLVRVEGELSEDGLALLNHGLVLDDIPLRPAQVTWQNDDQLRFVLTEGKKRQIRRMCELVGLHVVGLKRIRIGKITLGDLPVGQWRYLRDDEAF